MEYRLRYNNLDAASITDSMKQILERKFRRTIIMTNLEKYDQSFMETFEVEKGQLANLKYQDIEAWDSVGHMSLIAALEEAFDIMMDTDHIIDFSSYEKGKEILSRYYDIEF